jgi:hypothetical protein
VPINLGTTDVSFAKVIPVDLEGGEYRNFVDVRALRSDPQQFRSPDNAHS